jgi:hypothetical protein
MQNEQPIRPIHLPLIKRRPNRKPILPRDARLPPDFCDDLGSAGESICFPCNSGELSIVSGASIRVDWGMAPVVANECRDKVLRGPKVCGLRVRQREILWGS